MPQREFEITIAPDGSVELKSKRETSEFYEPDEHVQINLEQRH
jgi:hypothetical protein